MLEAWAVFVFDTVHFKSLELLPSAVINSSPLTYLAHLKLAIFLMYPV